MGMVGGVNIRRNTFRKKNLLRCPFSRGYRMLKQTARFILPRIDGNTLSKPLLGGVSFIIRNGTKAVGLTVTLKPRTARRCTISVTAQTLFKSTNHVQTVRHAKKTVECPWCMSVNKYIYIWKTKIRCERCLPIPILDDPELACELNLIPQYDWIPIPPGQVHAAGIIYTDGQIYAAH